MCGAEKGTMPRVFTWHFQVRSYEVDASMKVSQPTFLNYMEEAAVQASADAGYDYDWYRENHRAWVVRKMALRFYDSTRYGEALALSPWISDFKKVQCNREYNFRRLNA